MSPFNVCDLLLNGRTQNSINDRINLMFQDADLMPLFIAENYINMIPPNVANDSVERMVRHMPSKGPLRAFVSGSV